MRDRPLRTCRIDLRRKIMNRIPTCRALIAAAGFAAVGGVLLTTNGAAANDGAIHARADIAGPGVSGFATLTEDAGGVVHVNVKVSGLTAGLHGAHIHAIGSCTDANGTAFGGAGSHFDPAATMLHGEHTRGEHGAHHAGDLPNLIVNGAGQGRLNTATAHFTLSHDTAASLFDSNGSAIVVHANQDDYVTQSGPTGPGGSGARIACGVIQET